MGSFAGSSHLVARRTGAGMMLGLALLAAGEPVRSARAADAPTVIKNGMGQVSFLRFSPDGRELVRICQFGGVELLATDGYAKMRTFPVGMRMIAYSPDGTRIGTAEGTDGARVFDAALPGKLVGTSPTMTVRVLEEPLHVLEAPSGRRSPTRVFRAEFSPDGKHLVTTHANGHLKVWSTASFTLEEDVELGDAELRAAAFAPDGKTILVGGTDGVLHVWSLAKKAEVAAVKTGDAVLEIVFAPDGKTVATVLVASDAASITYSVAFWDGALKPLETKQGWSSVAISRDGAAWALGGKHVELLDPTSRKSIHVVELPEMTLKEAMPEAPQGADAGTKIPISVVALAFSPDGKTLAVGCVDGTVRLVKTAP